MARAKGGFKTRRRRKKLLKKAEGYYGMRRKVYSKALETVTRALRYAYVHRKTKKREFRSLWIIRISAAAKNLGTSYSRFIAGLKSKSIELDRKVLADIAASDAKTFESIATFVKS